MRRDLGAKVGATWVLDKDTLIEKWRLEAMPSVSNYASYPLSNGELLVAFTYENSGSCVNI